MPLDSSAIVRAPSITVVQRPQFLEPTHRAVQRVGDATDGEQLCEFAGRLSTMSLQNPAGRSTHDYLAQLVSTGHTEVFAHASYSVLLEGVSRAAAHALARIAGQVAITEMSERFVEDATMRFVVPPAILGDASAEALWSTQMELARDGYRSLLAALLSQYGWVNDKVHRRRLASHGAAGVLPNSIESRLLVSASIYGWREFLQSLSDATADLELRRLCVLLLPVLAAEAPGCFGDFTIARETDRWEVVRGAPRVESPSIAT